LGVSKRYSQDLSHTDSQDLNVLDPTDPDLGNRVTPPCELSFIGCGQRSAAERRGSKERSKKNRCPEVCGKTEDLKETGKGYLVCGAHKCTMVIMISGLLLRSAKHVFSRKGQKLSEALNGDQDDWGA